MGEHMGAAPPQSSLCHSSSLCVAFPKTKSKQKETFRAVINNSPVDSCGGTCSESSLILDVLGYVALLDESAGLALQDGEAY